MAIDPNKVDDRTAMGLQDGNVGPTSTVDAATRSLLQKMSASALVDYLDMPEHGSASLLFAGQLLGLVGDPRIRDAPTVIRLEGGEVSIGTPTDHVGDVVEQWSHVGVREDWILKEAPQWTARVAPFALSKFPVTNFEYALFVKDTGWRGLPSSWRFGVYPSHLSNHPVWSVKLEDANAFAGWISASTGRSYRLPTEIEWEYAARGGCNREYPWGDSFDPVCANTLERGLFTTAPVGTHPSGNSRHGIADLGGNVEELTSSFIAPYPGGVEVFDDLAAVAGSAVVTRGGCFARYGDLARSARRHGPYPREMYAIGFRLAEDIEGANRPGEGTC